MTWKTKVTIWSYKFWRWFKSRKQFWAVSLLVIIGYLLGTFYPNTKTQNSIISGPLEDLRKTARSLGLAEPSFNYYNQTTFIQSVDRCIDYVYFDMHRDQHIPKAIIIAMAMIESDNGSSRFALEGNNLFGVRTWDLNEPQMKPYLKLDAKWGVKKYKTKCASVRDMIDILNHKDVHKKFRFERNAQMRKVNPDVFKIVDELDKWAQNPYYRQQIKDVIKDNLTQYMPVVKK